MSEVYLDNAATTPISDEVLTELTDKYKNLFGNASTLYGLGRQAKAVLEDSRHVIAQSINADDDEIVFTSGGSESDNTAVLRTAEARKALGRHIITTAVEHEAILKPMHYLEKHGFRVTYLPVDENGQISMDDLKDALDDDTILVSIMSVNNEVGSIMPIHEIGELLKVHQAWFHTDAVQAYGLTDIDVKRDHIDLLSTSAHKINGPKMMGFLYRKDGLKFTSFVLGGDQEEKRRAGTENVPGIAGFAAAVKTLTPTEKAKRETRFRGFKQQIVVGLKAHKVDFDVNGSLDTNSSPHVLNLWIKGISTYVMQNNLDLDGYAISGGSACTAGNLEPSHVLIAMYGKDNPRVSESIRVSFGRYTTEADVNGFIETTAKIVERLNKRRAR
ncbi:cysteine desulfurase NifS [Fructilactobacillus sanfranciscensis]|uniref:cysteine desulfurase family protein n=1 Tax=Fructilactobacillus sanfranciscensis TaxID=1625 RepID=UPI000CD45C2E|nr:cysteine desulfurase family protein [Fructilactobacillus sanfranciscensis]POH12211.1 cysteine desulfurase NifS [Fructilactobacillus sanfranciscensis]POH16213.1 cysteine desulfurase NifS [Fructilactobacillus sanfranciscensis]POH18822.1 cysteine desulfurase NifS [Fructilactobacillus sanfranciscensis]